MQFHFCALYQLYVEAKQRYGSLRDSPTIAGNLKCLSRNVLAVFHYSTKRFVQFCHFFPSASFPQEEL